MTRILILAQANGVPTEFDNQFVVEYDPTRPGISPAGHELFMHLITTPDVTRAREFADVKEAFEFWRQSHGVRSDGKPNRPLTAFTVTFE